MLGVFVGFGRALRAAGLAVGPGDVTTFCAALRPLDPTDLGDVYWAGRTTMVTRRDDIAGYDEVFRAYFLGDRAPAPGPERPRPAPGAGGELPVADPGEGAEDQPAGRGVVASGAESLRRKSFADCTPDELRTLRRIMAGFRLTPPRRRTRRHRAAPHGRHPDLRRTVRDSLRLHGEPVPLRHRERRVKPRPLVLILDVSGSMTAYSRALLQFAYSARQAARRVEVFCFGTRLTRITVPLQRRSPDVALAEAAERVVDWEGGTRIGASLEEFVRVWGRRGTSRGAVVVLCSDGHDRGDPDVLARAMERLARQSHRIVWCHPRGGQAARTLGMAVAEPHIDLLASGHDLDGLARLAAQLRDCS